MSRRRCPGPRIERRYKSLTHLGLGNIARHAERQLRPRRARFRSRLSSPPEPSPGMPNEAPVKTAEIPTTSTEAFPKVQHDDGHLESQEVVDSILFGGFLPSDDKNDNDDENPALDTGSPLFVSSDDDGMETPALNTGEEAPAPDHDLPFIVSSNNNVAKTPALDHGPPLISYNNNNVDDIPVLNTGDEVPALNHSSHFPQTPPSPENVSTLDSETFARAQIADQPRLLIDLPLSGRKLDAPYSSLFVDKWWYAWEKENPTKTNVSTHIGRIMETELGTQLFGDKKCTRCQNEGLECWVYSEKAVSRVKFAGTNCARCRALPVSYGCSFATRRRNGQDQGIRVVSGNRSLLPKEN